MTAAATWKGVLGLLSPQLARLGFGVAKAGQFRCELPISGVSGWIGLNKATRGMEGGVEVNPMVGVRHESLEQLVAELRDERGHAQAPATVSVSIGYLMTPARYVPWLFAPGADPREGVESLVRAVREVAVPFMRENAEPEALLETMHRPGYGGPAMAQRIPAMLYMLGRSSQAKEYLHERMRSLGDRRDEAADAYRRFATELLRRIAAKEVRS